MPRNISGSLLFFLLILGFHSDAQVGKAVSRMQEGKWSAAEPILLKAISKDSLDVEARLQYSRFFFSAGNPRYNLDSARAQVIETGRVFSTLQERQRERLVKSGIDSLTIQNLKQDIDSAAFERAKKENTVAGYESFITRFPDAGQVEMSKELMNEVAYLEALRINSPKGFRDYLSRFPGSRRAGEARERLELLVYQEATRDGKLSSFRRFVETNPLSAHRGAAERRIFEMSTATGEPERFRQFLTSYPGSVYTNRARNILYYLNQETGAARFLSDSLSRLDKLNQGYWVPFFKNGLYGFMDDNGGEAMAPRFAMVDSSYLCGNIREDVVLTSDGLFSRGGHKLLDSPPQSLVHLGQGFLYVSNGGCGSVVHKSGFTVGPACAGAARIVSDHFIAISEKGGKWKLYAFNGVVLSHEAYEDVAFEDKIIILTRSGKKLLTTEAQWMAAGEGNAVDASLVFDGVRTWGDGNLVVRNGALEGVINQKLEFIIALDRQTLAKTSSGFVRTKDGKRLIVGAVPELERQPFDNIIDYGDWMILVNENKSTIYRVSTHFVAGTQLDSVWFRSNIPFGLRNDSLIVFGLSGKPAAFESKSPLTFLKSRDTLVYYWVQDKKTRSVFEAMTNRKLFSLEFEDVESITNGLFIIRQKNKKGVVKLGLVDRDGKPVLPSEYDAIIPTSLRYLSLLKDKLFGQYDVSKKQLINAAYERNLLPYSDKYLVAYRGGYGLVDRKEESVSGFEFDEIKYWNDTSAWVRKGQAWSIYSIKDKATKLARIRNFQYLIDTEDEKIVRVQQDSHFGIVSSVHGVIVPATFSEVLNIGSDEKPFYFTDKRVEEAEIDVVIYYDYRGKMIRKQIYESDEYEKIYCEEN